MAEQNLTVEQAYQLAYKCQWDGKLAEAEGWYQKILQVQPGNPDVLVNVATVLFASGRQDQAQALIKDILNKNPGSIRAYSQRDRMDYVLQRAGNPQVQQEQNEMRQTMAAMDAELRIKEIYVPSAFWETHGRLHLGLLDLYGVENFKRTVGHHYQNWVIQTTTEPQMKRLLELWPKHFSSQPYSNTAEKPDDVGVHSSMTCPFYDLANPQPLEIYKLAIGLLWELTRVTDPFNLLQTLEESPIGRPVNIRRQGKLISSDLAHSLRERNQMLQMGGATASDGLVVGELGGGSGRLAEIFGLTTNYRHVIFDVTPALYVSQWYIKKLFPNEKIFEFRPFSSFSDIEAELSESRFAFFTANQIEMFPTNYFDMFMNVNSLMEMAHRQRANFLGQIDRLTKSLFFSQQWFKWDNAWDKITVTKADFNLGPKWQITYDAENIIFPDFFVQIWKRITA